MDEIVCKGCTNEQYAKLRSLLGNNNVYFQPPESVKLKNYKRIRRYDILHIHRDPDVDFIDEIDQVSSYVRFDRRYVSDNLYHDAYTLYY